MILFQKGGKNRFLPKSKDDVKPLTKPYIRPNEQAQDNVGMQQAAYSTTLMNPADAKRPSHSKMPWPPYDDYYQENKLAGELNPYDKLNPTPDTTYENIGDYTFKLVDASYLPKLEYNNTINQPLDVRLSPGMHRFVKDVYLPELKKRFKDRVTAKLSSGYRPLEEQKKLYESGASKTLNSEHLTGQAADLQLYDNGKWMYGSNYDNDSLFNEVVNFNDSIANANDIFYGKNYENFKDLPHFGEYKTLYEAKKNIKDAEDRRKLGKAIKGNREAQEKLDEQLKLKAQFEELARRKADTIPRMPGANAGINSLIKDIEYNTPRSIR
jgi:hypothetical protein